MAERTLPGLGLHAGWVEGEDHWGDDNDANLQKLSALVQCSVLNTVAVEPGGPADGDMYLLSGTANAKKIAVRDNGAWVYFAPVEGWWIYDKTANSYLSYDGAAWGAFTGGGGGGSLPTGGTTGQVLTKLSGTDGDADWEDPTGGGGSGSPVQQSARIWRLAMGIANRDLTTNLIGFGEVQWYDASNTLLTGSGFAYASSEYNPGLSASHAFNGLSSGDGWIAATDGRLGREWIAYDFTVDVTPTYCKLVVEDSYNPSWPLEITHQFSQDGGETWITTDVWVPAQPGVDNVYQQFDISPVALSSGGGSWYFAPPSVADFTLVSGDGGTMVLTDDSDAGLLFDYGAGSGGTRVDRIAYTALANPAADWDFKLHAKFIMLDANYRGFGVYARAASGKALALYSAFVAGQIVEVGRLNSVSSFATAAYGDPGLQYFEWYRIRYDFAATTLHFYVSNDGKSWLELYSESTATFLGGAVTGVGFGGLCQAAGAQIMVGSIDHFSVS